jgi:hypothetical protein
VAARGGGDLRSATELAVHASRCGPAAVANVNRSLGEAATTEAEGAGRHPPVLDRLCILGLTLDEPPEVGRVNTRRKVTVLRDLDEAKFREHLRRSNDPARRYTEVCAKTSGYIVNFSRAPLFGAGVGHHSPIGGYLESEDLVFVLDVNADYQPWLVERSRLFAAIDTRDGDDKRGLLLVECLLLPTRASQARA